MNEEEYYDWYYEDNYGSDVSTDDNGNWMDNGDGTYTDFFTGETYDENDNFVGYYDDEGTFFSQDEDGSWWQQNPDGNWQNTDTGEIQDDDGNTIRDPLFEDPDSGLEQRDPNANNDPDYSPPTDFPTTQGGGFFSDLFGGIGNFFSGLLGGPNDGKPTPGGSGSGASGASGGGSSSGSNSQNEAMQRALQQMQQQLAAAQRANANPNVVAALQEQIRQLQGGGGNDDMMKLLLVGGVLGVAGIYIATRNSRAA